MPQDKKTVLKNYFGYDEFREGQELLIDHILGGHDVLGVMPTGAGKSICFQVPAMLMEGITLVISPLISLMKDQVNALTQAGIRAAYLNSSLTAAHYHRALENAKNGDYSIIYVAPERLLSEEFLSFAKSTEIAMVTVDEAHCISAWGQDFRPSYTKIVAFIEQMPHRPVISAFTATATAQVREDIVSSLKLQAAKVLITGFDRENLYFEVQKPDNKLTALLSFLQDKREKSGIVYCATRKAVEEICECLLREGFPATRYHAGLIDTERKENQEDFIFDRAPIMVATNAFGMGIDKSNVSFVVHYNMPKNMESYYQEAGRAGRDGQPAECILLYNGQDVRTNLYFIEHNHEAAYADEETECMVKERERKRLKEMTFYCHSNDCLRGYMMSYFGENPGNYCGNCGNCNSNFEEVDITADAQVLLNGIVEMRGRYGVKTLVDLLRGSKNEKMLRLGMDRLPVYGASKLSEKRLRDIIHHLVLQGFLGITDDEYPVLKLGARAKEILQDRIALTMKLSREDASKASKKTGKAKQAHSELYERLKALRMKLAKNQGVPAYVVFSDSTLTDMCEKLPMNEDELLGVSGVGQVKLERYGKRFLEEILAFEQKEKE